MFLLWTATCALPAAVGLVPASPKPIEPAEHLGDIMGKHLQTDMSILANNETFTPMQRVALTANGNFQRILSSFFNKPVSVTVVKNLGIRGGLYEREVIIEVGRKACCVASSVVICLSPAANRLIESGKVGIGQLFYTLEELPKFSLIDVAKTDKTFKRVYTLASPQVVCHIEETMPIGLFEPGFLHDDDAAAALAGRRHDSISSSSG